MIYEDLIYLWLAFIIYELIPQIPYKISFSFLLFFLFLKEFIFILSLFILRKRFYRLGLSPGSVLEKLFMSISFIFYIADLMLLNSKINLEKIHFSSLIGILWFLHYMFLIKFFLFRFSSNYLRILIGIIVPVLFLVVIQDVFNLLGVSFQGDIFLYLTLVLVVSPFLMVKAWPVEPLQRMEVRQIVLEFLKSKKVKIREIYVLKDLGKRFYTAGIIGFLPPFKYLFFSKPLLNLLSIEEILGVVAHEVGHLKKKHNLWLLLLLLNLPLFLLTVSILVALIVYYFNPHLVEFLENKKKLPLSIEMMLGASLIFLSFVYIRYIFSYFLRQFEREADFYSAVTLKTPQPIISALFKIGEITGQLYKKSWHHYGIFERIEFLNSVFADAELFKKVKRKSVKIRLLLIFWIILNVLIVIKTFYPESFLKGLIQTILLFSIFILNFCN